MSTSSKLLAVLFLVGCGGSSKPDTKPTPDPAPTTDPAPADPAPPAEPPAPPPVLPVMETSADAGLATPESVLYDEGDDVYYVSNINGGPSAKDGNGFISKLSPDGKVVALKWIDGTAKTTPLNAPKGMALVGDLLYVADLDTVRVYDKKTGKAKGTVAIKGSTFLNDVTAGADGTVYVSDTGVIVDDKGITPTKTDAVYAIKKMKAKAIAKSEELGQPNGLWATDKGLWVNTFGTGEVYLLDDKGARSAIQKVAGLLDGLYVNGDDLWVSSWEASGVLHGTAGGELSLAQGGLKAPADFAYDTKRKVVVVPLFNDNKIVAYSL
jgi:sugar lactone lactonase YvrE